MNYNCTQRNGIMIKAERKKSPAFDFLWNENQSGAGAVRTAAAAVTIKIECQCIVLVHSQPNTIERDILIFVCVCAVDRNYKGQKTHVHTQHSVCVCK